MLRRTLRLAAVALLATAAGAVVTASPAAAAACDTADGVTVVVDFHELGGGVQQVCDAGGAGSSAGAQFAESGFTLTRVQRQPGFVCRVNGAPSEDPCVNTPPADAYWGLWWSDGTSGSWSYASQGVDSLTVPEGGYVALSWNGSTTKSPPGAAPTAHAAEPTSSPNPTPPPTPAGGGSHPSSSPTGPGQAGQTGSPGSPAPSASSGESPSDGASATALRPGRKKHPGSTPSVTTSPGETDPSVPTASTSPAAAATSEATDPGDGGLPGWVAPAGIALLFAAAAGTAAVRRRRAPPP